MRIVVTGREGQVVRALIEAGAVSGDTILSIGRPEMDLTDPQSIEAAIRAARPDVVVSAAAYTAVDKAESERDVAIAVNGAAPGTSESSYARSIRWLTASYAQTRLSPLVVNQQTPSA